jgi:hypothetical protein
MKTLLQICQYIGNSTNKEFSTVNVITDVSAERLQALNLALSIIWNMARGWNLRYKKTTFSTVIAQSDYAMVNGEIQENGVKIEGVTIPLPFYPGFEYLVSSDGLPCKYWVQGDYIVLYPTPSSVKVVTVKYQNIYPVKTVGNVEQDTFINANDVLNIPTRLETYFITCLTHLTNKLLNADPSDEDYIEHNARFNESLIILKNADIGTNDNQPIFTI